MDARLGARNGPGARGILGQFTHPGATGGSFGLRATAIAAFHFCFGELAAGVSGSGKSESAGEEGQIEKGPDGETAQAAKHR